MLQLLSGSCIQVVLDYELGALLSAQELHNWVRKSGLSDPVALCGDTGC